MTATLVKVILDRFDGAQNQYVRGSGWFRPSLEFPDPADQMLIGQAPVPFAFRSGALPFVEVIANDTAGPQQDDATPGWSWVVEYDRDVPGCPQGGSYYVLSTNGSTQRLSELTTAPVAQPGAQYLPLPSGSAPSPGDVLTVTGTNPLVTAYAPGGGIDGGSAVTGQVPAYTIDGGGA